MVKSITVRELIAELKKQPQDWPVFASVDPEGNAYGSFRRDDMIGGSNEDKVLVLYPIDTHMDDEVMPKEMERVGNMSLEEMEAELRGN